MPTPSYPRFPPKCLHWRDRAISSATPCAVVLTGVGRSGSAATTSNVARNTRLATKKSSHAARITKLAIKFLRIISLSVGKKTGPTRCQPASLSTPPVGTTTKTKTKTRISSPHADLGKRPAERHAKKGQRELYGRGHFGSSAVAQYCTTSRTAHDHQLMDKPSRHRFPPIANECG